MTTTAHFGSTPSLSSTLLAEGLLGLEQLNAGCCRCCRMRDARS